MEYIDDFIIKDDIDWHLHFRLSLFDMEKIDESLREDVEYINKKLTFIYSDNLYQPDPFIPMFVWSDGTRSVNVQDLELEDIEKLKYLIHKFKSPIIKGRIFDILGILDQSDSWKQKCESNYLDYFNSNYNKEKPYKILPPLRRSLYLMISRKDIANLKLQINNILNYQYDEKDKQLIVFECVSDLILNNQPKIFKEFISNFESILEDVDISCETGLDYIETLIKYFKSIKNTNKIEKYEFLYVEVCKKLNEERMPHGHEFIKKAIKILDDKYEDKIDELRFILDDTSQKLHDSLQYVSIPINKKVEENLNKAQKQIIEYLQKQDTGVCQFLFLLKEFRPMQDKELKKHLKDKEKYVFTNLFNNIQFDQDKKIVYESSESPEDKKQEHNISQIFQLHHDIIHDLMLKPFIFNLKLDKELKELIKEIISHNLFVPYEDIVIVYESIIACLNKNIRGGMFKLVAKFEKGCREYLKSLGMYPIIKKGSQSVNIDLNHILVEKKNKENRFRKAIVEIWGEDLTLAIEYLSCRPLSGNIRNDYYHNGAGDENQYYPNEMLLFFYLIKAYCLGYDSEINKDA